MKTKELLFGACLCMFTACNMPEKGMDVDVYEALDYCDAQVTHFNRTKSGRRYYRLLDDAP